MTPTPELRFVERKVSVPWGGRTDIGEVKTVKILQQKWAIPMHTNAVLGPQFVWRDVPLEKEA